MNHPLYNQPMNNRTLGRGLGSLIPSKEQRTTNIKKPVSQASYLPKTKAGVSNQILHVSPKQIKANPYQPRKNFEDKGLESLRNSIREHGILQPLVVTQTMGGQYELVAGERRLRAAQALSLKTVPVIVRTARDLEKLELSLVENIQRKDLNPIEKAEAYKQLMDNFSLTQEEASKRLGIARSTLNNNLRLLNLSSEIQVEIASGKISEGQAKVMLSVPDQKQQKKIFDKARTGELTVKDVEKEVRRVRVKSHTREIKKDPQVQAWERDMQQVLGTRVYIRRRGQEGGIVEIEYYSEEELKGIVENILK